MIRRLIMWGVAATVFGFIARMAIPVPGGAISLAASGHASLFWSGFAVVAVLDIAVLRRLGRRTTVGQVPE